MTIHWKAVEQHFDCGALVFLFYQVCNVINFGLGTVESVNGTLISTGLRTYKLLQKKVINETFNAP